MDSANSISEPAWEAMDTAAGMPILAWAGIAFAGVFGIIVLVFPFSDVSFGGERAA